MNLCKTSLVLYLFVVCAMAENAQSQFDCDSILTLWKAKKIEDLRNGFGQLAGKASLNAKETAALAFRDYIFLGDLPGAKAKLELVSRKYESASAQFPPGFRGLLNLVMRGVNSEIRIHEAKGRTNDELRANANPSAVRDEWGDEYHPIIDLILATPSISMSP